MAQLIAFNGMPHIPGFQFWATRGQNGASLNPVPTGPPGFSGVSQNAGARIFFVTCIANTAHAILGKALVVIVASTTIGVFEFTEGGLPVIPGAIPVIVANGDTAAVCATALAVAINNWAAATLPFGVGAATDKFNTGTSVVAITTFEPQVPLVVVVGAGLGETENGGRVYGDMLLHRAWRAMVYQGVDPAFVSGFPVVGPSFYPDIALAFWPLHPMARKAFPKTLLVPYANHKPLG